jgi:adenylate kinase
LLIIEQREYALKKIEENNESEIMQTVLDEAREAYPSEAIVELRSDTAEELEGNVARLTQWVEQWLTSHAEGEEAKMMTS